MAIGKRIKHVSKKLPLLKDYARYRHLHELSQNQAAQISILTKAVDKLENRNKEWEKEVRTMRGDDQPLKFIWPVSPEEIISADWTVNTAVKVSKKKPPYVIAWVVPPMGQGSGGHADIFRTINFLESKGHTCHIYFYDALRHSSLDEIKKNIKFYSPVQAKIFYNQKEITDCDAIFATNWYTAYPVFNYKGNAKKYYYVQDFEPYFDAVGSYSTLAENTYKFGLRGLTLGSWLSEKLTKEYGMKCDPFELGTNPKEYYLSNTKPRKKVLFYARPVTPRRGFELGILALELFHKEHPEYEIHFLGWDTDRYEINFPYVNHGVMPVKDLNKLYNECSAGLVLSFTNMSLLPLEMLASGCIPVMNDAYHTRKVTYQKYLKYSQPNPAALAAALFESASAKDQVKISKQASEYAKKFRWDESNDIIEKILVKELS